MVAWPLPLRTLLLSALMAPAMTWLVVPFLTRLFRSWLTRSPHGPSELRRRFSRSRSTVWMDRARGTRGGTRKVAQGGTTPWHQPGLNVDEPPLQGGDARSGGPSPGGASHVAPRHPAAL